MSKTKPEFSKYRGYKFYKYLDENELEIVRVISVSEFNNKVIVLDEETKSKKEIPITLLKGYTLLEPYGFIMFNKVYINHGNEKLYDVAVMGYRLLDVKANINEPFCICRQSVTDFFYTLISEEEEHEQVGVSCNRENCPTNIDYRELAACDGVEKSVMVNFYRDDTLDDILKCIDTTPFDKVLTKNYITSRKNSNMFYIPSSDKKEHHNGWCKKLKTLLQLNNFITDIDAMRNTTAVTFDMSEFLLPHPEIKEDDVYTMHPELLKYFSYIFKIPAKETTVIPYGYDIDFADFKNQNYTLLRDNKNITYLVVYTTEGEYLEADLLDETGKLSVSEKLMIEYFNKYSK